MIRHVVLLRAINAGIALPMTEARASLAAAGFGEVRSYIASGNFLLDGEGDAAAIEARVEAAIAKTMGVTVRAIARSAAAWKTLAKTNPFADAARERPSLLHLAVSKYALATGAAEALAARAAAGERMAAAGGALWIDFAGGVSRSKLTPAAIDRAAGSIVTARNWNTVTKLRELAG